VSKTTSERTRKKQRQKNPTEVIALRPYNFMTLKDINLLLNIKKFDEHVFFSLRGELQKKRRHVRYI
jgi:hypothetical protein